MAFCTSHCLQLALDLCCRITGNRHWRCTTRTWYARGGCVCVRLLREFPCVDVCRHACVCAILCDKHRCGNQFNVISLFFFLDLSFCYFFHNTVNGITCVAIRSHVDFLDKCECVAVAEDRIASVIHIDFAVFDFAEACRLRGFRNHQIHKHSNWTNLSFVMMALLCRVTFQSKSTLTLLKIQFLYTSSFQCAFDLRMVEKIRFQRRGSFTSFLAWKTSNRIRWVQIFSRI